MNNKKVGVIGGVGPSATAYFMKMVINNTKAEKDQDNVDMLVCQYASIPDRTNYILDNNSENPVYEMIDAAKLLEREKCDFIVLPCNTATYFYDEIQKSVNIPIINIVKETINYAESLNPKKIGLMATDGTIKSNVYQKYALKNEIFIPDEIIQKRIMNIIYNCVKKNITPDINEFMDIVRYYQVNGCDIIITGCTELSVALIELNIHEPYIVDSLEVLAKKTIIDSGKLVKD